MNMGDNHLKYVCFYDCFENYKENRNYFLSATNKVDYIISSLVKNGYKVKIVSPSWTNNKFVRYKGKKHKISENVMLQTFFTIDFGKAKGIKQFVSLIQLFVYLLKNTKKDEPIIVYHSIALILPIILAKKIKKFSLILEVEEIYNHAVQLSVYKKKLEDYIFTLADKFIFSTTYLNETINDSKPYVVVNGVYKKEEKIVHKKDDEKINVVYSGTFDLNKGGALSAIHAAKFLTDIYCLHILGFGSDDEIKEITTEINNIQDNSEATIKFVGLLRGKEYIEYLQSCDIGLSTQYNNARFNDTSFPSKILTYMANGLSVVSSRIKTVEESSVGKYLYYYDNNDPEEIAQTIMSVDLNSKLNTQEILDYLDNEFTQNIFKLLNQ
ncbi:MAG: glycosyltransferase [Tissierellales bacterium]|nr:glycosyltransferase [Tissierellales bacterium]